MRIVENGRGNSKLRMSASKNSRRGRPSLPPWLAQFDAEAPSQLLEEWVEDVATLQTFAKHYQTGAPIPAELVARMKRPTSSRAGSTCGGR